MRIKIIDFLFVILFIFLGICLSYIQIIKGPIYRNLSYRNSIRLLNIDASRGTIYDRKGKIVADNALSFGVFIVPQEVEDLDLEIKKLSKILDLSESLLKRNYKRNYRAPFAPSELARDIPKRKAILIEELKIDMPGVIVKEIPQRRYLYNEAFGHVIGYLGEIDKKELDFLKSYGYSARDMIGKAGVEKISDSYLRGKDGGMQIQVDNKGRQVKILNFKKPIKGKDVYLTLDAGLQSFLWKMMEDKLGTAIFMDTNTGEILALVNSPSYDPNISIVNALINPDAPLLNRAIKGQYPAGSIFKVVIALLGLESGKIDSDTTFTCHGALNVGIDVFHCWDRDGHGVVNLKRAIIESCNSYIYNLGILLGVDRISEYAKMLGFGKRTGIELLGEEEGFVPSRSWKRIEKKQAWYAGDTANLSIGQGYLLVTPLQVVRFIACVANGGEFLKPYVLKKIGNKDIKNHKKIKLKIKEENLKLIRDAMRGVVEDEDGTGFRAWSEVVSISGKTATSQVGGDFETHAVFTGFAPSLDPKVSFIIFLEHGGSGGDIASMIARKAVEYWYKNSQ